MGSWRCEIVDKHFNILMKEHLETKFLKLNAEKCPFLVERLSIVVIPTIICVVAGRVAHHIVGFDEFGGVDDFSTETMAKVLAQHKMLSLTDAEAAEVESDDDDAEDSRAGGFSMNVATKRNIRQKQYESDDDLSD